MLFACALYHLLSYTIVGEFLFVSHWHSRAAGFLTTSLRPVGSIFPFCCCIVANRRRNLVMCVHYLLSKTQVNA